MRNRFIAGALFLSVLGAVLAHSWPTYQARRMAEKNNRYVAIAIDYEDLQAAADGSAPHLMDYSSALKKVPVSVVALSEQASTEDEKMARDLGFHILWQIKTTDYKEIKRTLARLRTGDGVMSTEKQAPGYPMYVHLVAQAINEGQGFLPIFEFLPQKGMSSLAAQVKGQLVKAHLIGDREVFSPRPALWQKRLDRAVRERGVRFFYLRLPPSYTWEQKVVFLRTTAHSLLGSYVVGAPGTFLGWDNNKRISDRTAQRVAIALAILTPIIGFLVFVPAVRWPVVARFLLFSAFSTLGGVTVYFVGGNPSHVLGLSQVSGVKLQLVLPLLCALVVLSDHREWRKWLEQSIKVKHLVLFGGVVGLLGVFYLMRSGNFPLIPVTDSERHFRDALESLLGARPRFKEFFIGHPAVITAFYLQRRGADARVLLVAGLIGQISIVNTFLHFHVPLELGLLRTFHGVWIGLLVGVGWCLIAKRFLRGRI